MPVNWYYFYYYNCYYYNHLALQPDRMAAAEHRTPQTLQEFTRFVPPGWRPYDDAYLFKAYMERLFLWWRITPVGQEEAGPLIAARLLDRAFSVAMKLEVWRNGQRYLGDAALALPRLDEELDAQGMVVQRADISGAGHLMSALRSAFELHEQDKQGEHLDSFFDVRRGGAPLQTYLMNFREKYNEASDRSGLQISAVCLTHLLFKWSGLLARRIADIKLHINSDLSRYEEVFAMLSRIAKQEMSAGSTNHFSEDFHAYDEEYYQQAEASVEYFTDLDEQGTMVDFAFDEDCGLYYREYWTEAGDWSYGAYDEDGCWYEAEQI